MKLHPTQLRRARRPAWQLPAGLISAMAMMGNAHAIDVDAGDYTALPVGTNLGLLYYQHAERDRIYSHGERVSGGKLTSDVGIARYVRYVNIGGYTATPQILLPFGRLNGSDDLSALGRSSGVGDPILAATVFLLNDQKNKRYFGVTPYLYLPLGSYNKNRALNLGENRWKFAVQAGYTTPLSDRVTLDLVGDVMFFGKNADYGPGGATLKQKPLFSTQAWLRYDVSDTFNLRAGLSHSFGGESKINGAAQEDDTNTSKFSFGFGWSPAPAWQLIGTVGRDISVRNGPMETSRVNLRLLKAF